MGSPPFASTGCGYYWDGEIRSSYNVRKIFTPVSRESSIAFFISPFFLLVSVTYNIKMLRSVEYLLI